MRAILRVGLGLLAAWPGLAAGGAARAAVFQDRPATERHSPHERPGDPPLSGEFLPRRPAGRFDRSGFVSVQVNLDADGMNILGDAANEPSIAVDPRNRSRIAIGWRQFDTINSNFRQAGVAYSRDGGRSWISVGPLDAGVFRSDPVLRADAAGRIYYYSLQLTDGVYSCELFVSDDGGASWAGPIPAFGGDKPWIAVDRTGGPGHGHLYAAWDYAGCCGESDVFTRSVDAGASFMTPVFVPDRPDWGTITIDPQGRVFVAGNHARARYEFSVVRSSDAQDAFMTPTWDLVRIVDLGGSQIIARSGSPNPFGLLGQVWIVSDHSGGPRDGWLYMLCSVDPPGTDPLDVNLVVSSDGGETWSAAVQVTDEPDGVLEWQWFGTLGIAPNGRLDLLWNDTLASGDVRISELRYSASYDGGASWTEPVSVSPAFDSYLGWPNQDKLGDYYDIESDNVGAFVAYAATFNGEQDVYCVRIGPYDCNGNDAPDEGDIAGGTSADVNGNGVPDECECIGDVDGDWDVDFDDLVALLAAYGSAIGDPQYDSAADVNADGAVDFADLVAFLARFGDDCFS